MPPPRRACLAIGVSDAGGGLDYLGGALEGAKGMHAWATALGYESRLLTDEDPRSPVTIEAVREALAALLPLGSATERLILYFAGHGLISRVDNGLWLLNRWREDKRALAVELLRRRLREFGVNQIAIIADACRSLPADIDAAELTQDGVLGVGFVRPSADPVIDRFTASQEGRSAYMIPATHPGETDRCIFSGVLLEGLWGQNAGAFSKRDAGKVISTSLSDFLRKRVPEVAGKYKLTMHPQALPGFPELADVYFDRNDPPAAIPPTTPWPAPKNEVFDEIVAQQHVAKGGGQSISRRVLNRVVEELGDLFRRVSGKEREVPPQSKLLEQVLGALLSGRSDTKIPTERPATMSETDWESFKARFTLAIGVPLTDRDKRQLEWLAERPASEKAQLAVEAKRHQSEAGTLALIRSARVPPDLHQGLVIAGDKAIRLWAPAGVKLALRRGPGQAIIEASWPYENTGVGDAWQILVEFEDGNFAACVLMRDLVTRVAKSPAGPAVMMLQPYYSQYDEIQESITVAESAIARLASGALDIAEASDLAANLRMIKHVNPVLGVISAYLYDAIGDLASIRRMSYFYVQNGQAIPFDIAFLGELYAHDRGDGVLVAMVPAQEQRKPRTEREAQLWWTTEATPAAEGVVGGRVPWLRQGWAFVVAPSESERLMTAGLEPLLPELLPSKFALLGPDGGRGLVSILQLQEVG